MGTSSYRVVRSRLASWYILILTREIDQVLQYSLCSWVDTTVLQLNVTGVLGVMLVGQLEGETTMFPLILTCCAPAPVWLARNPSLISPACIEVLLWCPGQQQHSKHARRRNSC
jgi:hypothetical protein